MTTELLTAIKQHGAVGVLAVWILSLQAEVKDMKAELFDCLKKTEHHTKTRTKNETHEKAYFVMPEKKRRKDENGIVYDC